jgi:hypothetical protein
VDEAMTKLQSADEESISPMKEAMFALPNQPVIDALGESNNQLTYKGALVNSSVKKKYVIHDPSAEESGMFLNFYESSEVQFAVVGSTAEFFCGKCVLGITLNWDEREFDVCQALENGIVYGQSSGYSPNVLVLDGLAYLGGFGNAGASNDSYTLLHAAINGDTTHLKGIYVYYIDSVEEVTE